MNKAKISHALSVLRLGLDRRTVGGMFLGAAVMLSAGALADSGTGWFTGLLPSVTGTADTSSTPISQQESVMLASLNDSVIHCSDQPGGIGYAINTAVQAHTQIASATPNVESLFDVNNSCFSSISQIFDLSFSIPSLGSILSAAESAVLQYAQKKVCTAVNGVTGMVTTPINSAIGQVNGLQGFTNINGMANNAVASAMSGIDPQLGAQYHPTVQPGTYTSGSGFNSTQTTFTPGTNTGGPLNDNTATINSLTQQIGQQQIKINQDQMNLQAAQNAYNSCGSGDSGDCSSQYQALQQATQTLMNDQAALIALQTQLSQVITQNSQPLSSVTPGTATISSATSNTGSNTGSTGSTSWWNSITKLFP